MTNELKKVPELRFPEFEGEWEEKSLSQVLEIKSGKVYKETEYTKEGTQLVQGESIDHHKIKNIKTFLPDEYLNNTKNVVLKEGDIVLALNRPIIKNNLKIAKIPKQVAPSILYQRAGKIIYDKSKPDFYLNLFDKHIKDFVMKESVGSDQPFISTTQLKRKKIYVPRVEMEITKLNNFFSKLDRQIELEEQKLAKLEEQKKGYMQKIFSQKIRFKDENGNTFEEWKNTNFNYFMSEPDNLEKGIDLRKDQLLTVKLEGNGVSKANINRALKMGSTVYYKRFAGQFIYGKQNFFNGAFGIVPKFLNNYYSSGDVPALNIDYSKIDSKYFINYISRKDYYKKTEAFSTGTGSKRIHEKTLLDLDIMLPSVEEQEKIGNFFSEIDHFIEKQLYKVELLKDRKKGFLQKMFV